MKPISSESCWLRNLRGAAQICANCCCDMLKADVLWTADGGGYCPKTRQCHSILPKIHGINMRRTALAYRCNCSPPRWTREYQRLHYRYLFSVAGRSSETCPQMNRILLQNNKLCATAKFRLCYLQGTSNQGRAADLIEWSQGANDPNERRK